MTRADDLADLVRRILNARPIGFDDLFDEMIEQIPDVEATEVDTAARAFETGVPGAYVYRTA